MVKLDYIGTSFAQSFLDTSSELPDEMISNLRLDIPNLLVPFAVKQILLAALGACLGVWLIWRSRPLIILGSAFLGSLIIFTMLFWTAQVYDISAFKEPEYQGVLAMAPNIIPAPNDLMNNLEMIQGQTRKVASNIQTLFTNVNSISVLANPEEDYEVRKILLASDLHSNPIGIEFLKSLAHNFQVDIIIDTGDLTDFGNPLETKMTEGLLQIDLPYIFVPGNHDTPEIINFVKEMRNSIVLEGQTISIKGITIKGGSDPLAHGSDTYLDERAEWEEMLNQQVESLSIDKDNEDEVENMPDILAVHNHEVAKKLSKTYPLVVNGHTHQVEMLNNLDQIRINPGTSGAAGLRGLYSEKSIPYSAVILYIKPGEKPIAADIIKYEPLSDRFFLERKLFKKETTPEV